MEKDYWFEWKNKFSKPQPTDWRGNVVVVTPFVMFCLMIASFPIEVHFPALGDWSHRILAGLFALSLIVKWVLMMTKTGVAKQDVPQLHH